MEIMKQKAFILINSFILIILRFFVKKSIYKIYNDILNNISFISCCHILLKSQKYSYN